jgi:1,4-dihydroxy-2-naphthoate octaprenyltransferase
MQPAAVIRGYVAAVAVAYLVVVAGVVFGVLPWPTLISLLTFPLAYQTWNGLKAHYDSPYQLMSYLGKNVNLHLSTGLLLVIGVVLGILIRR